MALNATEQKDVARAWVAEEFRKAGKTGNFNLNDLGGAASALHDALVFDQATLIASLPEPFKSTSTGAQKKMLLAQVAMKMAGLI